MTAAYSDPAKDNLRVFEEALTRRTIAVISHPDAGKSTLTEALLLHSRAIDEAGAVHGKPGRRGTVSDWMEMERSRGISVSSTVIQFPYADAVVNLVDTPGHADFSEDTFRVLSAVDAAIMLVDAAKGLETQTMQLFEVCRSRKLPILTLINKWDRPGRPVLDLVDEIRDRTGLVPMPLNWPVGEAGFFRGLASPDASTMHRFRRASKTTRAVIVDELSAAEAAAEYGAEWENAIEELALLSADGHAYRRVEFFEQRGTPLFFGSAVQNIGIDSLLRFIAEEGPRPQPRSDRAGRIRPVNADFSAQVFKVQSGMNPAHHDRLAFIRVCSGVFERGMVATHADTGKPFPTKYSQQVFGRDRTTVDRAVPGDIVGLVNAAVLRPGDTLYRGDAVRFPRLPRFAPSHFCVARCADTSKYKRFGRALGELDEEGVVQVLFSHHRSPQEPILGAVGPMQFEVAMERMRQEFDINVLFDYLDFTIACTATPEACAALQHRPECEIVERHDGSTLALFTTRWRLAAVQRDLPHLQLDPAPGIRTDLA